MASYSTNEFRPGVKVILDGKGQAFNRVKLKRLFVGRTLEKTFKSGEKLEAANVQEMEWIYLYSDGDGWHFMNPITYDQMRVDRSVVADAALWLMEQAVCTVVLWNDEAISVVPPTFIEAEVVETDPGLRGDTAASGGKPAKLSTGAQVKVPLFVQIGETIRVDTRTGIYVSRVLEKK
eukprot:Blabericola_migrator_1__9446@NODE_5115_length_870_cov_3_376090_g3247_i0_p1_GENE_NODE_5115_length_870_cov_3_376090_g3247_i0NODE_5115_length_870_cov_3_376090_g3247_i0_p1_ORF_typecomplete_len178_score16_48ElongfactP_C/PF09285_11/3e24EFP/PF01132_20/2_3e17EFP_N/PF08207_12/9_8EFP_N/PF08207_12/3_5e08_NODE_5115_length_870_cov_3_376090_g3247_i060593